MRKVTDSLRLTRRDILLLVILLALSLVLIAFWFAMRKEGATVRITCDGRITAEYRLTDDGTYLITGYDGGYNRLVIANGTVSVTEADCPDLICVHHTPISHAGETIVCLPHRVVVSIVGQTEGDAVI